MGIQLNSIRLLPQYVHDVGRTCEETPQGTWQISFSPPTVKDAPNLKVSANVAVNCLTEVGYLVLSSSRTCSKVKVPEDIVP